MQLSSTYQKQLEDSARLVLGNMNYDRGLDLAHEVSFSETTIRPWRHVFDFLASNEIFRSQTFAKEPFVIDMDKICGLETGFIAGAFTIQDVEQYSPDFPALFAAQGARKSESPSDPISRRQTIKAMSTTNGGRG
eukprot:CAMPEP_0113667726 /NCGR_PEP_ID=MMETSP0038_2-20120614/3598_1 /TAXON_ID=2898 /ORGANISM="Cryptomonas paramecium" /LENGTH=134 /DNA_ID=CAMNT_0000583377 /DNA_START=117 /DNA_END=517 /DNA_ORIENTATION=- /assembly_acc=CAM_ASM_000170